MRAYHTYTTGDNATIRKMWGTYSKEQIAEELGVTKKSLEDHIADMQPPLPKEHQRGGMAWESHEDAALRLMVDYGCPEDEIAVALQRGRRGIRQRVQYLRRKHGWN